MQLMRRRLQEALQSTYINIIDDSHLHIGHAGAQGGLSHFTLEISSEKFIGQSKINCHRQIYNALDDMMINDIHALRIKIINQSS